MIVDKSCTGIAARWCPVHGDCTDRGTAAAGHCDDQRCPLHGDHSTHADPATRTSWATIDLNDRDHATCRNCGQRFELSEFQTAYHYSRSCPPIVATVSV